MSAVFMVCMSDAFAAETSGSFNKVPSSWKWISDKEVAFTYDGTYTDSLAFSVNARSGKIKKDISAPEKYSDFPLHPEGAVNLTYSPDSTKLAFTRDNDLYVADIATGKEARLTFDGTDLILNGYASWVYYEEILGRSSRYKAFWWSPDSRRIGFYRFDNTFVPLFPIYSPFGQDGKLNNTRYPKAGERNPEVRIGMVDVSGVFGPGNGGVIIAGPDGVVEDTPEAPEIVWADFDPSEDQYFGIPFWGADSREFYIARMPRIQNTLDLYAVNASDGSKRQVYHEEYKTWIDWITAVSFTDSGLYMARRFETGWEQIYFLYNVSGVRFSPDGKYFAASYSNYTTPTRVAVFDTYRKVSVMSDPSAEGLPVFLSGENAPEICPAAPVEIQVCRQNVVVDMAYERYSPEDYALPQLIWLTAEDGQKIPAAIVYPKNFDPSRKYPVHMDIYGGPDSPMVRDRWSTPGGNNQWWSDHGIIQITADGRAAGHCGRAGTDLIYKNLTDVPVADFIAWAEYLQSLPYVQADKIGVEGFSFGGTMTSMLLFRAPEQFHYGIAGGGVYDWKLYDSHYTERYMETPQTNPDGYKAACALEYVSGYPVSILNETHGLSSSLSGQEKSPSPVMLKLTHGTGDDNVHFQNTLQLIDALQKAGKSFDFMIYPDGMHGYRGYQGTHFLAENRAFWLHYLKGE